jgi:hypothetical protein
VCSLLKSRIKIVHVSLFIGDVAAYLVFAYALFQYREWTGYIASPLQSYADNYNSKDDFIVDLQTSMQV